MKFIGVILFFLLLSNTAYAISPITIDMIKEAQHYGQIHVHSQLDAFLRPWESYEEKAERLNETAEHAWLYTPFLLIATDAREKALKGQKSAVMDSGKILNDYAGTLSFSAVLVGTEPHFGRKAKVTLRQGKEVIQAYAVTIPAEGEKTTWHAGQGNFRLQCYFYFWDKKILLDQPIILSIVTDDKKEHHFYFAAAKIK